MKQLISTLESLSIDNHTDVRVMLIPDGLTGLTQPCDLYLFSQYKQIYQKITNMMKFKRLKDWLKYPAVNSRKFGAITHLMIHQQLKATISDQMIKGAWPMRQFATLV